MLGYGRARYPRSVGMLVVRVVESAAAGRHVRRVVLLGFMESADLPKLRRALVPDPVTVRLIVHRVWRCESKCVQAMVTGAAHLRAAGGSLVWVMPAPELHAELELFGESGYVVLSDPVDRELTAEWT